MSDSDQPKRFSQLDEVTNEITLSDHELSPTLEEADTVEIPEAGVGTLFSAEDLPSVVSKVTALESMLKLISADLLFKDFIRDILLIMMRAVPSEAGSVLEVNHRDKTIFFRTAAGHSSDQIVRFVIPMGQGIVGYVAESRQPLVVSNASENERHLSQISKAVGFDTRNLVAFPLVIRGKIFGVLELLNRVGETDYTENDVELLTSLCEFAARAIEARILIGKSAQGLKSMKKPEAA